MAGEEDTKRPSRQLLVFVLSLDEVLLIQRKKNCDENFFGRKCFAKLRPGVAQPEDVLLDGVASQDDGLQRAGIFLHNVKMLLHTYYMQFFIQF
jgi:hypothetical protein